MKVLVAEDNSEVTDLVVSVLNQFEDKPEIQTADTGESIWKKIKSFSPDLLILDLKLPGVYGTEILNKLRKTEKNRRTKVLVMTSYFTPGVLNVLSKSDPDGTIKKPFDPGDLRDLIAEVVDQGSAIIKTEGRNGAPLE